MKQTFEFSGKKGLAGRLGMKTGIESITNPFSTKMSFQQPRPAAVPPETWEWAQTAF